jgi:hypothetical protein
VEELALREDILVGELSYVILRLHRDMNNHSSSNDIQLVQKVILNNGVVCVKLYLIYS